MDFRPDNLFIGPPPDEGDEKHSWQIIRTPATGKLSVCVVSQRVFGIRTHFHKGRTGPHLREGCEACRDHREPRWTGYLLALAFPGEHQVLFEFPPPAARQIEAARLVHGKLRGLKLRATRAGNRPNGKVLVAECGLAGPELQLPPDVDILPVLYRIWQINPAKLGQQDGPDEDAMTPAERF